MQLPHNTKLFHTSVGTKVSFYRIQQYPNHVVEPYTLESHRTSDAIVSSVKLLSAPVDFSSRNAI